jgi:predicted nucleic acid-binding protein
VIPCYFDTGLVLKLVVKEPLSVKVQEFLSARRLPVPYPLLVQLEFHNALHAKLHRGEITPLQLDSCLEMESDFLSEGRFQRVDLDCGRVFHATLRMIPGATATTGCRTLDLLHIATAQLCGTSEFVTGDARQAKAARFCGLNVVEIR